MKRIITDGIYNKVECSVCKCVYSFDKIDLTEDKKIICPQCGAINTPTLKPETEDEK